MNKKAMVVSRKIDDFLIGQLVGEISNLAHRITATTKTDVFVSYSAHVKQIDIDIFENGWREKSKDKKNLKTYLDCTGSIINLESIINELKKYL